VGVLRKRSPTPLLAASLAESGTFAPEIEALSAPAEKSPSYALSLERG